MTDSITERLQALTDEKGLDPAVVRLMWAAFTGQADLDTAITDAAAEFAPPTTSTGGGEVPVWLNSIAVEGFRGIGPRAELVVDPGPGLTLVVGRNGSGKSSFAEGRFAPIAAHASELWAGLRQQSNVSLEGVTLEGKRNNRRVNLDVTVDGTETSALGVMSQGELHALALSLFLPRVTSVASPFRFVLIDDPVQAMDPARVDGLAKVLAGVARERQVIVFTHDDRLPAACRRLALEATVFEVDRRANSKVSTRWTDRPSRNALDDASTIARSRELPDELQRRIVPVHCRRAVEAAAREEIWHKLLSEGRTHDEVEQRISDAQMAKELLAILLECSAGAVQDRLDDLGHNLGRKFGFLNVANHSSSDVNVDLLVNDAKKLVDAIHGLRR